MTLDEAIAISEEIGKGDTTRAANNRWLAQKLRVLRWVEECHIIGEAQRARGEMHKWQLAYRRLKEDHAKLLETGKKWMGKAARLESENERLRIILQRELTSHDRMCTQRGHCFTCMFFDDYVCGHVKNTQEAEELGISIKEIDG